MKKLLFSFVMMIALVIVTGTAMAQTSVTPYLGGTYSYTVSGLDQVSTARFVEVYITDAANAKQALTGYTANAPTTGLSLAAGTLLYSGALTGSPTPATIGFNIDFATSGLTAGTTYRLWVKIYNGTSAAGTCYNARFITIVPAVNNFNLVAAVTNASICQTITPDGSLAVNTTASAAQSTVFTYTVTKTGGDNNDDWSFDFKIPSTTVTGLDISNITSSVPTITTGTGTNTVLTSGTISAGTFNVKVTNSDLAVNASVVTITITIPTAAGVADAAFAATISAAKLYVNQTATVSIGTETNGADNTATTTLKSLPAIGGFIGN